MKGYAVGYLRQERWGRVIWVSYITSVFIILILNAVLHQEKFPSISNIQKYNDYENVSPYDICKYK